MPLGVHVDYVWGCQEFQTDRKYLVKKCPTAKFANFTLTGQNTAF